MWLPPTLADAIDGGFDPSGIPSRQKGQGPIKYMCDCGTYVQAGRIVDLRSTVAYAQDWACDGCHTAWRREAADDRVWMLAWCTNLGAPANVLARWTL